MTRLTAFANFASLVALSLLALNAGFFYTWSFTIMQALDLAPPEHAISAMQTINANIRSASFGIVFFGAPLATLVATILLGLNGQRRSLLWSVLASLAIIVTVAVTFSYHVPWNNELATLVGTNASPDPALAWASYSSQWTAMNHLRTVASSTAFIAMLAALLSRR